MVNNNAEYGWQEIESGKPIKHTHYASNLDVNVHYNNSPC